MAGLMNYMITLWMLVSATLEKREKPPPESSGIKRSVREICSELCKSSVEQNLIFVFVLFVDPRFEVSFVYFRKLPRALIYLSDEDVVLGKREREIVLSWERDPPSKTGFSRNHWDLSGTCGHRENGCQLLNRFYQEHFRLEKRVLLQIREGWASDFLSPMEPIEVLPNPSALGYLNRYRAIFIILTPDYDHRVRVKISVRRTGEMIGNHVMKLKTEEFSVDHVRNAFRPQELSVNRSNDFALEFQAAFFSDKGTGESEKIHFERCPPVSWAATDCLNKHDFEAEGSQPFENTQLP